MIFDSCKNFSTYVPIHPAFQTILEIISDPEFENKEDGRYETGRDDLFYTISTYEPENYHNITKFKYEYHKKYADVQIVLRGIEDILYYESFEGPDMNSPDFDKGDISFVEEDGYTTDAMLGEGDFAVFFPGELHKPGGNYFVDDDDFQNTRKVVFKVLFN